MYELLALVRDGGEEGDADALANYVTVLRNLRTKLQLICTCSQAVVLEWFTSAVSFWGQVFEPFCGWTDNSSFFLTSRATKQRQTKPGVLYFFLLLPPQGCKAPHLFFTPSPSGNKSKGRRAKPGVLKFFSLLSPRNDAGPLISFFSFSCTGNESSGLAKPG